MDTLKPLSSPSPKPSSKVALWFGGLTLMVIAMVVVGGLTRLTGSGLSMVDWKPLMGILPPVGESQWQEVFLKYQSSPEYQLKNYNIGLEAFKTLFWWEYGHRMLGRLLAVVFLIPWIYFVITRQITLRASLEGWVGFMMGGLQGLVGWYMVQSGLINIPQVSHYRLAAHLCLAALIMGYFYALYLKYRVPQPTSLTTESNASSKTLPGLYFFMLLVLFFQLMFGAFMAGTHAGWLFQDFPTMGGSFLPDTAWAMRPVWINAFENPIGIHWIHRMLGWLLGALACWGYWLSRKHPDEKVQRASLVLLGVTFLQFVLGVLTVLLHVPLALASLHQLGATFLLLTLIYNYLLSVRFQSHARLDLKGVKPSVWLSPQTT